MTAADDRGVPLKPFLYLSARVADVAAKASGQGSSGPGGSDLPSPFLMLDTWRDGDVERAADLLCDAYTADAGVYFAPHGEPAEWLLYVTLLVEQTQCGTLEPRLTRVLREGDRLRALAIVTSIAPLTIHLAQLAVHPGWRRQGLARWLLADITAAAAAEGCEEITLLVRESNRAARRLYAAVGFTPQGMGGHYGTGADRLNT